MLLFVRRYALDQLAMALALVVVVACTVILATQRAQDIPLSRLLNADGPVSGRWTAYVVFRAADCDSRLDFLALFDRPEIASRVSPRRLLLLGNASEYTRAIRELGSRARGLPIARGDHRLRRALKQLGANGTPMLALVDADGAVRLLSPGPQTPPEYVALAHMLTALDVAH